MAYKVLAPVLFTKSILLNPTYAALTGFTGVQWQNTGREVLAVINGATASTYTVNVGTTFAGHTVSADGPTALPVSNTAPQFLGPWDRYYNDASGNINIDLSSVATVTAVLLQLPGVY